MNPGTKEAKKLYFQQLETAINLIFYKEHTNLKYEECYRSGYHIVQYHSKDELIQFFKNTLNNLLTKTIQNKLSVYFSIGQAEGEDEGSQILSKDTQFLIQLSEIWSDYQLSLARVTSILLYLDNRLKKEKSQHLFELGLVIFFKAVLKSKKLEILRLVKELIKMEIEKERRGEFIERNPIINTTHLFITIGKPHYEELLESFILEFSVEYYRTEGKKLNDENLPINFINAIYKFTSNEKDRCNSYLATSTLEKLLALIDDECLKPHLVNNIKNEAGGLRAMLGQNAREDLSKLFYLSSRIPDLALPAIVTDFKLYLLTQGDSINNEVQEKLKSKSEPQLQLAIKWTENFLNLKLWTDKICEECFMDNLKVNAGCNEAFVQLINSLDRAPEFISLFIDHNMREDFKRKGDSNLEPILDKAVNLFRFLDDKDVFEKYYKQHLAKRLLANSMSSTNTDTFQDSEKIMISKLQAECGYQFTMKIEGMFKDVQISGELTKRFKQTRETIGDNLPYQFNVSILTNTFWPISTTRPAQLNLEMTNLLNKFTQFYKSEFSGRKLEWITQFGSSELKMNGAKDPHDLIVNCNQLIVLMLFNKEETEEEELPYEKILLLTQLEEQELQKTLQSLSCGKFKILQKSSKTKNILSEDKFKFNKNFTNPQYRIKIPMVSGRIEGSKELIKTKEEIDETRKYLIDASIVRVMKDRKLLNLNLLIVQVTNQLKNKFKLTPNQIKLRIESLIEREYLMRDESDRTIFKYLA